MAFVACHVPQRQLPQHTSFLLPLVLHQVVEIELVRLVIDDLIGVNLRNSPSPCGPSRNPHIVRFQRRDSLTDLIRVLPQHTRETRPWTHRGWWRLCYEYQFPLLNNGRVGQGCHDTLAWCVGCVSVDGKIASENLPQHSQFHQWGFSPQLGMVVLGSRWSVYCLTLLPPLPLPRLKSSPRTPNQSRLPFHRVG